MPDESKKKQQKKGKNDPKEQRKSRPARHQIPVEKKPETTKLPTPERPVPEEPGPEFYKNLKRETDEILKITEEENSKYKKKEIQSNWSKYEMPIASYDDIEENENLGADFEKLIQASQTIGGYFQFKHEKSWDVSTAPSLYDKYFQIDMDNLGIALCTIPFYERNGIELSIYSETDILNMNNRSVRYKQKYYNDKIYSTPESEVQDKILKILEETPSESNCSSNTVIEPISTENEDVKADENIYTQKTENIKLDTVETSKIKESTDEINKTHIGYQDDEDIDQLLAMAENSLTVKENEVDLHILKSSSSNKIKPKAPDNPPEKQQKHPPLFDTTEEDLEKWLDEYLDS